MKIFQVLLVVVLLNGCFSSCNPNQYLIIDENGSETCSPCDSPCLECSGPGSFNCISCNFNYFNSSNQCLKCHYTCDSCSDSSSVNCSCSSIYVSEPYYYNSIQYNYCINPSCRNQKQYYDPINSCQSCSEQCQICFGSSSSQCLQCATGYYQSAQTTCSSCALGCATCPNSDQFSCLLCKNNFQFETKPGSATEQMCVSTVCFSQGKLANALDDSSCVNCDNACSSCYGGSNIQCFDCTDGHYKSDYVKCLTCDQACKKCSDAGSTNCQQCNIGYYQSTSNTCSSCHLSCATCSSPNIYDCSACKTNFSPSSYEFSAVTYSICLSTICQSSEYSSSTNGGSCISCHFQCSTCYGPTATECITCKSGYFLSAFTTCSSCYFACSKCSTANNGYCSECKAAFQFVPYKNNTGDFGYCLSCPTGQFKTSLGSTCSTCSSQCKKCYDIGINKCFTCADQYYQSGGTTCSLCNSPCFHCTGALNGNCSMCQSGYAIHSYLYDTKTYGFCSLCTNPGQYHNGATCVNCPTSCSKCYGGTNTTCLQCSDGYFQYAFTTCKQCPSFCGKCVGELNGNCTTCPMGYNRVQYQYQSETYGFCLQSSCLVGQFWNGSSCQLCNDACQTCYNINSDTCLTCADQYFMIGYTKCIKCHQGCTDCFADQNGNCTMCLNQGTDYQLLNYTSESTVYGFCQSLLCSNKHYKPPNQPCQPCHSACQQCYGTLDTNCLSCAPGHYQTDFTTCSPCFQGCAQCVSSSQDSCTSCLPGYTFINYTYNTQQYGYCMETTCHNSNKVYQISLSHPCITCNIACLKCYGSSPSQCLMCDDNFYETSTTTCSSCHSQCLKCKGNNNNQCIKCRDTLYLTIVASDAGTCQSCQSPCQKCLGINTDSCLSCTSGLYLKINNNFNSSGECIACQSQNCSTCANSYPHICVICKSKYYLTLSNATISTGSCQICHYSCAECVESSDRNCIICNSSNHRFLNSANQCICGPWKMDSGLDEELCIELVCVVGSGESINATGYCSVVCGDGLVGEGEECDDMNSTSQGCDDNCKVEQYYICVNGSKTQTSVCYYATPIILSITSILKDPYSNSFVVQFKTQIIEQFMNYLDFEKMIEIKSISSSSSFTYNEGILTLKINYNDNLHSLKDFPQQMFIDMAKLGHSFSMVPSYTLNYTLESENNLALNYYSDGIYNQIPGLEIFTKIVVILGITVFAAGLVRGKVVSTEFVLTLQLTYFGLGIVRYSDPLFYSLLPLRYCNGYNINGIFQSNDKNTNFPLTLSNINMYPMMLQNINIMLIIPVLFALVGSIMLIFEKFQWKFSHTIEYINMRKLVLGQYLLVALMLVCFPVTYYLGVMLRYLPPLEYGFYLSIGIGTLFVSGMIWMSIHFVKSDHWHFRQFKTYFIENRFCQLYWVAHIIQRPILGIIFGTLATSFVPNILLIAILITHAIFVFKTKPFSLEQQNIRCIVNLLSPIGAALCYLISGVTQPSQNGANFRLVCPYFILILLLANTCFSGFFIYKQVRHMIQILIEAQGNKIIKQRTALQVVEKNFQEQFKKMMQGENKPNVCLARLTGRKTRRKRKTHAVSVCSQPDYSDQTDAMKERIVHFERYEQELFGRQASFEMDQTIKELVMIIKNRRQDEI